MPPLVQYYDEWEPAWDEPGYGMERIWESMYGHVPGENAFKSEREPQGIVYSCARCWTTLKASNAVCPRCHLKPFTAPLQSLTEQMVASQTCSRCSQDLRPEDEGSCPNCGGIGKAA